MPSKKAPKSPSKQPKEETKHAKKNTSVKVQDRDDEFAIMYEKLDELFNVIYQKRKEVTYSTFLAAIYVYYITNKKEFYTFIKHVEESITVNHVVQPPLFSPLHNS